MVRPAGQHQLAFVYRWGAEKERRFDRAGLIRGARRGAPPGLAAALRRAASGPQVQLPSSDGGGQV